MPAAPLSELATHVAVTRPQSLGNQVASAIRRDIILGKLPDGSPLPQEKLCEIYGVSRIPVRDALLMLANEGFVVRNRRNQMIVNQFDAQDLVDTFKIEAFIASLATRRATLRGTDEEIAELEELVSAGESAVDRDAIAKSSWAFHHKVNRMARSSRLIATLRAVSLPLMQDFMDEKAGWWGDTPEEHRAIYEAIRDRDPDTAEALTAQHFEHAALALLTYLENRGLGGTSAAPTVAAD
ncbi:GntR family transcriptional regulator [Nocardioides zeae]|nr:GntR family transcriptional regulator [Nocardioides zeae]